MGRNMYSKQVSNDDNGYQYPGCIWGFIRALDYHHHKNHQGRRLTKVKKNPQASSVLHDSDELQFLDDGENHLLVNKRTRHSRPAKKRSFKARIKALLLKEVSSQPKGKKQKSGSFSRSQLKTNSIHHVEHSDNGLDEIDKDKKPAVVYFPSSLNNGSRSLKVPNKPDQSKKNEDILEIFKVNKDLFLKLVGNVVDSNGKSFDKLHYFSTNKVLLTKSGSFPTSDLSRQKNFKPSTLDHKKNDIWFFPGKERFLDNTQVPELALLKYKKHFREKSWSFAYDYGCSTIDNTASSADQVSKRKWQKEGNNEMVIPQEESKQTAKPEPNRDETDIKKSHESDGYFLGKVAFTHRRSSSLTESLERYTRLYEHSSRQEVNLHQSKSLKLRNEYDLPSGGQISFKRIRSVSHLDFCYPIQNEGLRDAHHADFPLDTVPQNSSVIEGNVLDEEFRAAVSMIADEFVESTETNQIMGNEESLPLNLTHSVSVQIDDPTEKVDDSAIDKSTSYSEEGINHSEITAERVSSPSYKEDSENICNNVPENDSSINSEQRIIADSSSLGTTVQENFNSTITDSRNFRYSEFEQRDNADLCYVREILERSGLCNDAWGATSLSFGHPVSVSVFDEMEAYWHQKFVSSEEDMYGCSHHQLIYDLINEELVQLYGKSLTYYPKALSSSCRVRLIPVGNRILDEIVARISRLLDRKPDRYQTLDNIVYQDLLKEDDWMNLQMESECKALELEEMIIDELLEEIPCFLIFPSCND